jgi:hypothetical protein
LKILCIFRLILNSIFLGIKMTSASAYWLECFRTLAYMSERGESIQQQQVSKVDLSPPHIVQLLVIKFNPRQKILESGFKYGHHQTIGTVSSINKYFVSLQYSLPCWSDNQDNILRQLGVANGHTWFEDSILPYHAT